MSRTRYSRPCRAWFATFLGLAAAGVLTLGPARARAADPESRTYSIHVDGKKAGEYRLVIQGQPDGSVAVFAQSEVRVTVLAVPVYTYSYSGKEVWKGGQLMHLESSGKEKGKAFAVAVDLDGSTLRVRANGQERHTRPDVWTTSCWRLPEARFRNSEVALLGCDNGADIRGRLDYVGAEQLTLAGRAMACTHYRVMKDVPHDVWYDAQERLVRDEWVSGGHKSVIELTEAR